MSYTSPTLISSRLIFVLSGCAIFIFMSKSSQPKASLCWIHVVLTGHVNFPPLIVVVSSVLIPHYHPLNFVLLCYFPQMQVTGVLTLRLYFKKIGQRAWIVHIMVVYSAPHAWRWKVERQFCSLAVKSYLCSLHHIHIIYFAEAMRWFICKSLFTWYITSWIFQENNMKQTRVHNLSCLTT